MPMATRATRVTAAAAAGGARMSGRARMGTSTRVQVSTRVEAVAAAVRKRERQPAQERVDQDEDDPPAAAAASKRARKTSTKATTTTTTTSSSTPPKQPSAAELRIRNAVPEPEAAAWLAADPRPRCWGGTTLANLRYHDREWGRSLYYHPSTAAALADRTTDEYRTKHTRLFAILCLEMFQAGLSWQIVMKKWDSLHAAFHSFHVDRVASMTEADIERVLGDPGVIRNGAKVRAVVHNAKCVQALDREYPGGFFAFVWQFSRAADGVAQAPANATSESESESSSANAKGGKKKTRASSSTSTSAASATATTATPIISERERVLPTGEHLPSYMRSDFVTKAFDRLETDGVHPSRTVALLQRAFAQRGFKFVGETTMLSFMQACGLMNHHAHSCFAFDECEREYRQVLNVRAERV